jgi:hypothetical protein
MAGVFRTDPAWGYPAGAPVGPAETPTLAGSMHKAAFLLVFLSLVAACFVVARAFAARGDRPWSVAAAAVGVALPVFLVLALLLASVDVDPQPLSLLLRCIALVGWGFAALAAARVRAGLAVAVG